MAIAVPTGIKIFNWLATMWGGKIDFQTPMLFCVAFLFQFLIAGLTGVMLASAPFDWQLGNSYFVVAHFHYVIVGGILFMRLRRLLLLVSRRSPGGCTASRWASLHFWLFLIGFHLTFDFMHVPGLLGMPRRIYTYEPGRGWDIWNLIVTIGVVFQAVASAAPGLEPGLVRASGARRPGPIPGTPGPWSGPPPRRRPSTTSRRFPVVRSRRPLWDLKHPEDPDWKYE